MLEVTLAVVNASTLVQQDELNIVTAALQTQVSRDFAPAWNVNAKLDVIEVGEKPPGGCWWVVILDNSDLGAALGYHDLTPQGLPMAKVFVETAQRTGQEWSCLYSHEVLEMLADPYINLTALAPTAYGGVLYAYENCDACQSDDSGYRIDGHLMSDFCLPSWFNANKYGSGEKFDFVGNIRQPFELLPGGYAMCCPLAFPGGWQLVMGPEAKAAYQSRPRVGSRRERRGTGTTYWQASHSEAGRARARAAAGQPAAPASP